MGKKREIFEALETVISGLAWVKTINWEKILISETDIQDHEVPIIQIYDTGALNVHERGNLHVTLGITIELVLKQTETYQVDQGELFDKVEELETIIGENIRLNVPGFLHIRYVSEQTDLHTIDPYYYAALNFELEYLKAFSQC
jgi:hypothetical protein